MVKARLANGPASDCSKASLAGGIAALEFIVHSSVDGGCLYFHYVSNFYSESVTSSVFWEKGLSWNRGMCRTHCSAVLCACAVSNS